MNRTTIAERIHHGLAGLTPTERKAASLLMSDYPFPGLETVAAFARRAGISNPTVLRLIGKLGFKTYAEFQLGLREELQARLGSPLMRGRALEVEDGPRDARLLALDRSIVGSIERSLSVIPPATREAVLALLMDQRRRLFFLGGRLTQTIAAQFFVYMREMREDARLIDGVGASGPHVLMEMSKRSVLLVFDVRRYQDDIVRFAQEAAGTGATIVLFTDEWLSPIAADAAHVLAAHTQVASNWDSLSPVLAIVESLVAGCSLQAWERVQGRMEAIEDARSRLTPRIEG